jgi:hypothetical protein
MIGVIDAENQSSVDFHEKFGFKTVGIYESGLNLTAGYILFFAIDIRIKKTYSLLIFCQNRIVNKRKNIFYNY